MPQEKGGWADRCVKECQMAKSQNRPVHEDSAMCESDALRGFGRGAFYAKVYFSSS